MKKIVALVLVLLMLTSVSSMISCASGRSGNLDEIANLPSTSNKYMHTDSTGAKYSFTFEKNEGDTAVITGFTGDATIKYIEIPDTIEMSDGSSRPVVKIGASAFLSCTSVKYIDIPETVVAIESNAFGRCELLEEIIIPASVKYIGDYAFESCKALKTVIFDREYALDSDGNQTKNLVNDCASIGKCAFAQCEALEVIKTACVTYTKDGDNFKRGTLGQKVYTLSNEESSVNGVVIPESVKTIGEGAFYSCNAIKTLVLGNKLTEIGREAFYLCTKLENVTFPTSSALTEETMGKYMFSQSVKPILLKTSAGTVFEKYVEDMVYAEAETEAEETTVSE